MKPFDLVIFDNDGVLVDSEVVYQDVLFSLLAEKGLSGDPHELFSLIGGAGVVKASQALSTFFDVDLGVDFPDKWNEGVMHAFGTNVQPVDGVLDMLPKLNKAFCVASGSAIPMLKLKHKTSGLASVVNEAYLFSSSQVSNPKPAPDVFLYAAQEMGFDPNACLVVEDSVNGIKAGKSAGMFTVGFVGATHYNNQKNQAKKALDDAGADVVIDDIRDVLEILKGKKI